MTEEIFLNLGNDDVQVIVDLIIPLIGQCHCYDQSLVIWDRAEVINSPHSENIYILSTEYIVHIHINITKPLVHIIISHNHDNQRIYDRYMLLVSSASKIGKLWITLLNRPQLVIL